MDNNNDLASELVIAMDNNNDLE